MGKSIRHKWVICLQETALALTEDSAGDLVASPNVFAGQVLLVMTAVSWSAQELQCAVTMVSFDTPGPEVMKLFSCSALSMKFKILIDIKIATIDRMLRFKSSKQVIIPPANCVCGRVYCFHIVRTNKRTTVQPNVCP